MVYDRVDLLRKAIDSLSKSDFPKDKVPLIISIDGHVPEMEAYVESLKENWNVMSMVHPYSCHDPPESFPGPDASLKERESTPTLCAKHHFTWMLATLMDHADLHDYEPFLFLEEDYLLASTVYTTVQSGVQLLEQHPKDLLGLVLDRTGSNVLVPASEERDDVWLVDAFVTGPMTLSRGIMSTLRHQAAATAYCTFDGQLGLVLGSRHC